MVIWIIVCCVCSYLLLELLIYLENVVYNYMRWERLNKVKHKLGTDIMKRFNIKEK